MRYVVIAILAIVFCIVGRPDYLTDPSTDAWVKACTYHLYHANIFHLAANCLSVWFLFRKNDKETFRNFFTGAVIATLAFFIASRPVVGISNILFAMLGLRTPAFSNPWWKHPGTLTFFGITLLMLLFPQFSAVTHIASFCCGVAVAVVRRYFKQLDYDYRRAAGK